MGWVRAHFTVALTVVSVLLSAAVGLVSNVLVDSWGWALLTALLVLVTCLAIVEVNRHRAALAAARSVADPKAGPPADPKADPEAGRQEERAGITITGSRVSGQIAGRDAYQVRIGTGGFVAIAMAAILLGGGATYLGRTDAAIPGRALESRAPQPTVSQQTAPRQSESARARRPFSRATGISVGGIDLDPTDASAGTADVAFDGRRGLTLLNGAALAATSSPTEDGCRTAEGYGSELVPMPIEPGTSWCLRTSDGRFGSFSVTAVQANAGAGVATIAWTVW